MANAKPIDSGGNKKVILDKPKGTEADPIEIKSWSEMMNPETGKKMRGSFKLGDTVITNS